ncbi:MAG TPA: hypothetical protein PLJ78_11865 [Anaerolineae bacterium]|nr:hypothetical protein [Anaerolineae bacterium]HQK14625.1 hypothetical protein [Anaerolineae bacterium]
MKITHFLCVVVLLTFVLSACGPKPLLDKVTVTPDTITPNADGQTDLTKITFLLNRNAVVSIRLYDINGQVYTFRDAKPLSLNEDPYTVYFGGVVDGFLLPNETPYDFSIIKRMLPDGIYTWEIQAQAADGETATVTGTLTIQNADTQLPAIRGFSISPKTFSPNQDGIDDRVRINLTLDKDVEDLRVYLQGADGVMHAIPEDEKRTKPNTKGWHTYDYDGGIDAGSEPPPDGIYTVSAEARDAMGQRVSVSDTLEIVNAGLPRAYIVNGAVEYNVTTMVLSDTLCFTLTVENDSATYIRTTGPWPGTTYRSDQNFNTLGWSEESGVFRVGMDFDTSLRNYPFRWGIGQPGVNLVQVGQYWYLPPNARSEVTGCVQVVEMPVRNPLYYWMGLIHEDVEIAAVNNRVDPTFVTIWEP